MIRPAPPLLLLAAWFAGWLACWAAPAAAQSFAAQAGAEGLSRRCLAAGGTPRAAPGLVRTIELGGRAAAALDAQRFSCAGAAPVDCGPFGCKLAIYFGGPVAVFETHVKAWRARAGKLELLRVGAYCAGTGESCSETYRVEGEGLALAGKGEAVFATDPAPKAAVAAPRARGERRTAAARPDRQRAVAPRGIAQAKEQAIARDRDRAEERRAGRASTRGRFDATDSPAPTRAEPALAPVAPAVAAERRRKLDAAPYVP